MASHHINYTYDNNGNRLTETDHIAGVTATHTYDDANQLITSVNPLSGTTTYTYDLDGNCTRKETPTELTEYTWDYKNRLVKAETMTAEINYTYNALDQLVVKETPTETLKFVYDFNRVLQVTDENDQVLRQNTFTDEGYGKLISEFDGTDSEYHQYDGLGSTDALLDSDGDPTDRYQHRAFGLTAAHTGGSDSRFTFVGQQGYYHDNELDLYFLGMGGNGRPYDPATGRFQCKDRIKDDTNTYRYARNNPVNAVDPSGMLTIHYIPGRVTLGNGPEFSSGGRFSPDIASGFHVAWKVDNKMFTEIVDGKICTLCDEIGIIQIVKGRGRFRPFTPPVIPLLSPKVNYTWEVDSSNSDGAYRFADDKFGGYGGVVRGNPTSITLLSMFDDPFYVISGNYSVISFRQDFETYVVCLKGKEGIKTQTKRSGLLTLTQATDITVYAGVSWYHEFRENIKPQPTPPYRAEREIVSSNAIPGDNFKMATDKFFFKDISPLPGFKI